MKLAPEAQLYLQLRASLNLPDLRTLSPEEGRRISEETSRRWQLSDPPAVGSVEQRSCNGPNGSISLRIYRPTGSLKERFPGLVFYHGGGWVLGSLDGVDGLCRTLCQEAQIIVISADYRLAPENQFPAGVEDCWAATCWVAENAESLGLDPFKLVVGGDSAGGNLATVLAINSRDKEVIPIRGQVLVYPCVDLTLTMRSMDTFLEGMTLTFDTMDYFVKHYLNSSNDAVNWEASPLFAKDLYNLPETFIFAAGLDPLLDEGIAYKNRLKSFGNKVTYKLYPGQIHGFLSNSLHFPKATECIKEIGKAVKSMAFDKRN